MDKKEKAFFTAWMNGEHIQDVATQLKGHYPDRKTGKARPEKALIIAVKNDRKKYEGKMGIYLPDRPSKNKRGRTSKIPNKKEVMSLLKSFGWTQAKMNAAKRARVKVK